MPLAREERAAPAREARPRVARVVDRGVEPHVEARPQQRRERVRELHDANCGDEARDGLHLRNCRPDDEGKRPVDHDHD